MEFSRLNLVPSVLFVAWSVSSDFGVNKLLIWQDQVEVIFLLWDLYAKRKYVRQSKRFCDFRVIMICLLVKISIERGGIRENWEEGQVNALCHKNCTKSFSELFESFFLCEKKGFLRLKLFYIAWGYVIWSHKKKRGIRNFLTQVLVLRAFI